MELSRDRTSSKAILLRSALAITNFKGKISNDSIEYIRNWMQSLVCNLLCISECRELKNNNNKDFLLRKERNATKFRNYDDAIICRSAGRWNDTGLRHIERCRNGTWKNNSSARGNYSGPRVFRRMESMNSFVKQSLPGLIMHQSDTSNIHHT